MKITKRQLKQIIKEEVAKIQEGYLDPVPHGATRKKYRVFSTGDNSYLFEKLESMMDGYLAEKERKEGAGWDADDTAALKLAMDDAYARIIRRYS